MTIPRAGLLCLLAGCGACASAPRPGSGPAPPQVQLVDSAAWESESDAGTLRRVEVRHGARVDTLAGVLTSELPLVVDRSRVLGFRYEDGGVIGAFEYDPRTRTVRRDSFPVDLHPFFSAPAFSPDGRHIAYVVMPGDETGYAVARTWPANELAWRSAAVRVPATDAAGGTAVRWISPDTAEVVIEMGSSTDEAWYLVRGSVRQRAVLSADTMRVRPPW